MSLGAIRNAIKINHPKSPKIQEKVYIRILWLFTEVVSQTVVIWIWINQSGWTEQTTCPIWTASTTKIRWSKWWAFNFLPTNTQGSNWRGGGGGYPLPLPPQFPCSLIVTHNPNLLVPTVFLTIPVDFSQFEPCQYGVSQFQIPDSGGVTGGFGWVQTHPLLKRHPWDFRKSKTFLGGGSGGWGRVEREKAWAVSDCVKQTATSTSIINLL